MFEHELVAFMTSPSSTVREMRWRVVSILLLAVWIVTAILNMRRVHVPFVTTHLADVALPAWLYIGVRGLDGWQRGQRWLPRLLAGSPELVAGVLFAGATITELSQAYWPTHLFRGTYDSLDVLAFAAGIGACYVVDKQALRRSARGTSCRQNRPFDV